MYEYDLYLRNLGLVQALSPHTREWVAYRMLSPKQRKKLRRLMPDEFPIKSPKKRWERDEAIASMTEAGSPNPLARVNNLARRRYEAQVRRISELNKFRIPGVELRDFYIMHMDHIVPILYGFKNRIPVELMGSPANLQMLSARENMDKGHILTPKGIKLLEEWGYL